MWLVEQYLKYLISFVILWAIVTAHRNVACGNMRTNQMMPLIKQEEYFFYYPREVSVNNFERERDLVFFEMTLPGKPGTEEFVARVIGLPGDLIRIDAGTVVVNNEPRAEEYIPASSRKTEDMVEILIPRDHIFVLSDMRTNAKLDSRSFGPISKHSIRGRLRRSSE